MKNILCLHDLLSINSVTQAKNNTVTILIAFSVGVVITIAGTHISTNEYINYSLGLLGFLISIIAIGKLFSPTNVLKHSHTGEKLQKRSLYFKAKDITKIQNILEHGNIALLEEFEEETGQILTVVYSTNNNSFYVAQIFIYVPYEYKPYSSPIVFSK